MRTVECCFPTEMPAPDPFAQQVREAQAQWKLHRAARRDHTWYVPQWVSERIYRNTLARLPTYIAETTKRSLSQSHPPPLISISHLIDGELLTPDTLIYPAAISAMQHRSWAQGIELLEEAAIETIASDIQPETHIAGQMLGTDAFDQGYTCSPGEEVSPLILLEQRLDRDFSGICAARDFRIGLAQWRVCHDTTILNAYLAAIGYPDIDAYATTIGADLHYGNPIGPIDSAAHLYEARISFSEDAGAAYSTRFPGVIHIPWKGYEQIPGARNKIAILNRSMIHETVHYLSQRIPYKKD